MKTVQISESSEKILLEILNKLHAERLGDQSPSPDYFERKEKADEIKWIINQFTRTPEDLKARELQDAKGAVAGDHALRGQLDINGYYVILECTHNDGMYSWSEQRLIGHYATKERAAAGVKAHIEAGKKLGQDNVPSEYKLHRFTMRCDGPEPLPDGRLPQRPGWYLWSIHDLSYAGAGIVRVMADQHEHIEYLRTKIAEKGAKNAGCYLYQNDEGVWLSMYNEAHDRAPPVDENGCPLVDRYTEFDFWWLSGMKNPMVGA